MTSSTGGGGHGILIAYLAIYNMLFMTNLDIFLSENELLGINSILIFLFFCGFYFCLSCFSFEIVEAYASAADSLTGSVVPFLWFTLYVAVCTLLSLRTPIGGDTDLTQIFPLYQLGVLGFGMVAVSSPAMRRGFRQAVLPAMALLGASIVYETAVPGALGSTSVRSGGVALNANVGAFLLVGMLVMVLDFRKLRASDVVVLLLTALPVSSTLSRGGLAQFALVAAVYAALQIRNALADGDRRPLMKILAAILAAIALFAVLGHAAGNLPTAADREVQERLRQLLFQGSSISDDPYRGVLARYYIGLIQQTPIFGSGTGYTLNTAVAGAPFGKGPHNIYLRLWLDTGIWGPVVYGGFIMAMLSRAARLGDVNGMLLCLMVAAYGLFDHNVIDNKAILLLLGAALALPAPSSSFLPDTREQAC